MTLVWTRAYQDWEEDRKKIKDMTVTRLHCNRYKPYSEDDIVSQITQDFLNSQKPLVGVVTSQRSIPLMLNSPSLKTIIAKCERFYAVGEKTYLTLKESGLKGVWSKDIKNAKDLGDDLLKHLSLDYEIFYPGPLVRAFRLDEFMSKFGFKVHGIDIYQTESGIFNQEGKKIEQFSSSDLSRIRDGVTCFASQSAALTFASYLKNQLKQELKNIKVVVIGKNTYRSCETYFHDITLCSKPTVESLIEQAIHIHHMESK